MQSLLLGQLISLKHLIAAAHESRKISSQGVKPFFNKLSHIYQYFLRYQVVLVFSNTWSDPEGYRGTGPPTPPLKNHKNIGFLSNTGPDPLNNHKAT